MMTVVLVTLLILELGVGGKIHRFDRILPVK
jgi:hypothetical protein